MPEMLGPDDLVLHAGTLRKASVAEKCAAAVAGGFRALPADARETVFSDSELCVKTINEWAAGWERRGWRRKTGPIANLELVQALWAEAKRHPRVALRWIRAHDGSRWNEYADALAESWLLSR